MKSKFSFLDLGLIEYSDYLEILEEKTNHVRENPENIFCLFCTHPEVYTYGSGLEKSKGGQIKEGLIGFDLNESSKLEHPFFKIKRGGGLTFHHPQQLIIYPIFHLTHHKKNLQIFMMRALKSLSETLNHSFHTENFHYKGEFLGLWNKDKKIGSIGMGLNRFITQHGVAINLQEFKESSDTHLCGLKSHQYSSLSSEDNSLIRSELIQDFQTFLQDFLK